MFMGSAWYLNKKEKPPDRRILFCKTPGKRRLPGVFVSMETG